jgi:hypothetical protein
MGEVRASDPVPEPPPPVHRAAAPAGAWTTGVVRIAPTDVRLLELRKQLRREEERAHELEQAVKRDEPDRSR